MKLKRWLVFTAISDHSLAPLDLNLTPAERELAAHMQAQLRFRLVAENARNHARELYLQAERDYHHSNSTLDGQA